jgi:hypothetical protein
VSTVPRSQPRLDSLVERAAESLGRRERVGRLGSTLAQMARDLALARREIVALRRENEALRAQLVRSRRVVSTSDPVRNGARIHAAAGTAREQRG